MSDPRDYPVSELIKLLREGWLTTYERGQYADALASHFADLEAERDLLQLILADLNPDGVVRPVLLPVPRGATNVSEPTASDLAADVRLAFGPVPISVGYKARSALDALVARVDTLTRAVEEVTREKAAEGLRVYEEIIKREVAEAALARAEEFIQSGNWIKRSDHEAVLADTRRALAEIAALRDRWALATSEEPFDSTESFWDALEVADRALAAGDKP